MTAGAAAPTPSRGPGRPAGPADVGEPGTLLLARHARTDDTEQGRFAGRDGDDPGLSAAGEREAARLARAVVALSGPDGVLPGIGRPVRVVTSPLRRARRTAQAAADALGLGPDDVRVDAGWLEASFGAWEGLRYAEVARSRPAELAAWQASPDATPPGGDSLLDVVERVRAARRRVLAEHPGRVVLVVTHATCVRAVVHEALAAGAEALWRTRVSPAGLTAVRYWADGGVEVAAVNMTAHLAGL